MKICGRATFNQSADFKRFVQETQERGYRDFVFDLTECLIMDSTFLGVLAGFSHQATDAKRPQGPAVLTLVNPNARVADLLENLGVNHLFKVVQSTSAAPKDYRPAPDAAATREEIARNCLEAHEKLMEINPGNIPKFKDVTRFFAEDLERLRQAGGPQQG